MLPALNRKLPTAAYAWNGGSGGTQAPASHRAAAAPSPTANTAAAATQAGGSRLERQEASLWEEREAELAGAQEARLAQLSAALAAREGKREAYLLHRLEATAADKLAQHAARCSALEKERRLAALRLKAAQRAVAAAATCTPPVAAGAGTAAKASGRPVPSGTQLRQLASGAGSAASRCGQARPSAGAAKLAAALASVDAATSTEAGLRALEASLLSREALGLDADRVLAAATAAAVAGQPPSYTAARQQQARGTRRTSTHTSGGGRLPCLGRDRPTWQQRQAAAAAKHLEAVHAQVAAQRAAGGRAMHPLEAAQLAEHRRARGVHLPPVGGGPALTPAAVSCISAGASSSCKASMGSSDTACGAAGDGQAWGLLRAGLPARDGDGATAAAAEEVLAMEERRQVEELGTTDAMPWASVTVVPVADGSSSVSGMERAATLEVSQGPESADVGVQKELAGQEQKDGEEQELEQEQEQEQEVRPVSTHITFKVLEAQLQAVAEARVQEMAAAAIAAARELSGGGTAAASAGPGEGNAVATAAGKEAGGDGSSSAAPPSSWLSEAELAGQLAALATEGLAALAVDALARDASGREHSEREEESGEQGMTGAQLAELLAGIAATELLAGAAAALGG